MLQAASFAVLMANIVGLAVLVTEVTVSLRGVSVHTSYSCYASIHLAYLAQLLPSDYCQDVSLAQHTTSSSMLWQIWKML